MWSHVPESSGHTPGCGGVPASCTQGEGAGICGVLGSSGPLQPCICSQAAPQKARKPLVLGLLAHKPLHPATSHRHWKPACFPQWPCWPHGSPAANPPQCHGEPPGKLVREQWLPPTMVKSHGAHVWPCWGRYLTTATHTGDWPKDGRPQPMAWAEGKACRQQPKGPHVRLERRASDVADCADKRQAPGHHRGILNPANGRSHCRRGMGGEVIPGSGQGLRDTCPDCSARRTRVGLSATPREHPHTGPLALQDNHATFVTTNIPHKQLIPVSLAKRQLF